MPYFVDFNPIAISLGPLSVHWYGIMYLLAFVAFWWLGTRRASRADLGWTADEVSDLLFYGAIGVVLGGRIGYLLFYDFEYVLRDPHRIYQIWKGGMSFHGGLIGVLLSFFWFGHKTGKSWAQIADFVAPLVPPGLFFGRFGNFVGGELWGRLTDSPWGMIFPKAIDFNNWDSAQMRQAYLDGALNVHARHPSQLYEAVLEGLVLFLILWFYSIKPRPRMAVAGMFLMFYGIFRSFVEGFRQPDEHLGFIGFDWLTMGRLLSIPLVLVGLSMITFAYLREHRKTG